MIEEMITFFAGIDAAESDAILSTWLGEELVHFG